MRLGTIGSDGLMIKTASGVRRKPGAA